MSNDKRKFEYKESEEVETFFPVKKKKVYIKKETKDWKGGSYYAINPKKKI